MSASKNELIEIRMKLLGARQVAEEAEKGSKGISSVGKAATRSSKETSKASKATTILSGSYSKLGKAARYGVGFLGAGGLFALKDAVENTEELSKTTTGLNRNLGLSTQAASRWGAVFHSREIDAKAGMMSFTILGKRMVEAARKGGTALTPFHQLGLSQEDAAKGAKNFQWGLLKVADALGKARGGSVRQAAASALLGKGYATILPLFSEGTKGLKEQLNWADKFGVTLSGKTNKGLTEMIQAQRENKVAMLGLQVSMTKALMPAIKGGDDQLQEFIATLNSPKLSAAQKITRIQKQFEGLEDDLVNAITKALPKIAENGGVLGLKLAEAVWEGFRHSNFLGKLVIAAWIFKAFGGEALVMSGARKVGTRIGAEMGLGLATGATGAFIAYEIWEHLSESTRIGIHRWAVNAGQNFVNFFIDIVNEGITEINDTLNNANVLAAVGVDAPQIGEVGKVNFHNGVERQEHQTENLPAGSINGPGGSVIGPKGNIIIPAPHHAHQKKSPTSKRRQDAFFSPTIHTHVEIDGREVARAVTRAAEDEQALK